MSIDERCYELLCGAGLEPVLIPRKDFIKEHTHLIEILKDTKDPQLKKERQDQLDELLKVMKGGAETSTYFGGRAGVSKASGFIMRMMAENKKKHQGQYQNPSDNTYGSTMKKFVPFDVKKLAKPGQVPGARNRNRRRDTGQEYGASPFILKHFAGEPVKFFPKGNVEAPREGETEEQRAERLRQYAESLLEKAKELVAKETSKKQATKKVGEFLKGRLEVRKAQKELGTLKKAAVEKKAKEEREAEEKKAKEEKERQRKLTEADKGKLLADVKEEAKKLRKKFFEEPSAAKSYASGVYDYFSYGKGDEGRKLRETYNAWIEDKLDERFGEQYRALSGKMTRDEREAYNNAGKSYSRDDRPEHRGYSYKKMTYGEAKKIYDEVMKDVKEEDEETKEEEAVRMLGLKATTRSLIRSRAALKKLTGSALKPVWWNGVMAVESWAKKHPYSNMGTLYQNRKWFGDWCYSLLNNLTSGGEEIFGEGGYPEIKEPKKWEKMNPKEREAYNKEAEERRKLYEKAKEKVKELAERYYKWTFTRALPMMGWKFIDYKPKEADFPKEEYFKSPNTLEEERQGRKSLGLFSSHLRKALGGITSFNVRDDLKEVEAKVGALPETIHLLVEPSGELAYLVGSKSSSGFDKGDLNWKDFSANSIGAAERIAGRGQGHIYLSTKFEKVGDGWRHIVFPFGVEKKSHTLPSGRKVGDQQPQINERNIEEIIRPLVKELNSRAKWDGTPLISMALPDIYMKKKAPKKVKIVIDETAEEEVFD